ncbi:type II toxin-antitoxin system PemK/MazF family toxin [candidate division KSB1 bacterium]|nr:type II toxin-antitoxin system PemK/MazF family toxin [candidate division KSB1 bacterium]
MERGEVRWYTFKPPDKERPVVVLTRTSATQFLGEVTIAPITSTIREIPTEVVLDETDGMKALWAINLDHIQTVTKSKLGALLVKLSEKRMQEIRNALLFALGYNQ